MSLRRLGASPRPARLGGHRGWSSSPWVPSWMASLGRRHSHRNRPGQGAVSGFVGATPGGPPVGGGAVRRARAEGSGACPAPRVTGGLGPRARLPRSGRAGGVRRRRRGHASETVNWENCRWHRPRSRTAANHSSAHRGKPGEGRRVPASRRAVVPRAPIVSIDRRAGASCAFSRRPRPASGSVCLSARWRKGRGVSIRRC